MNQERQASSGSSLIKWVIAIVGSAFFLLFFALVFLIKQNQNQAITVSLRGAIRGAEDAKVTLVEFGDFQCPACRISEPFVRNIMLDFDKEIKFVFKHFPLTSIHKNALLSAQVSEAAGAQGKFWEMHDWLYDSQDSWVNLPGDLAKEKMLDQAKKLGLDIKRLEADMASSEIQEEISAQQDEGIRLGVNATPTFYLNNKKITNPQNYEDFKRLVQSALDAVK